MVVRGIYIEQDNTPQKFTLSNIPKLSITHHLCMSCMNMNDDSTAVSASMSANTIDDITNDMSKVAVSDNILCDTSSEQKLEEHIKSDEMSGGDASGRSSTDIDVVQKNTEVSKTCTDLEICANCGKEGSNLKACVACNLVKYCNRHCQASHRKLHKKECRKRAAEIHDIELFKPPPPPEGDCPICFLRLPSLGTGKKYKSCCGKVICSGCIHAVQKRDRGVALCPFCRVLTARTDDENINRLKKRVDAGDARGINNLGFYYSRGICGLPRDHTKALELFHRAVDLGNIRSHNNIGCAYHQGRGVSSDVKKAVHYWKIAAMKGDVNARHNLGAFEEYVGNMERALPKECPTTLL